MEYSQDKQYLMFEMKKSIINEFRYHYKRCDNFWISPDCSLEIEHLRESFQIAMSSDEEKMLRRYDFADLFAEALGELFREDVIKFQAGNKFQAGDAVILSPKGIERFIESDQMYQPSAIVTRRAGQQNPKKQKGKVA